MFPSKRLLHVANGSSTTTRIQQGGVPGATSIWADVLHEGPVLAGLSDEQLLEARARHLAGPGSTEYARAAAELTRWRAAIDNQDAYDELILWYEHDLFDQLNLIQVLNRIAQSRPSATLVSLICIGAFAGRDNFKGLGELAPGEVASLLDTRRPVTDEQLALATSAWTAFRAPTPQALEALLLTDTSALEFLGAALRRHLEEFPWTIDGLSRTERRVMELAQPGAVDLRAAFPHMHDLEDVFYVADLSYWRIVEGLAYASPPLVTVDVEPSAPDELPRGTVSLTETGRALLRGHDDRVRRCGVDRWLGGVHLEGRGPMWRWDAAQERVVNA
jgi:hypothetical protein